MKEFQVVVRLLDGAGHCQHEDTWNSVLASHEGLAANRAFALTKDELRGRGKKLKTERVSFMVKRK